MEYSIWLLVYQDDWRIRVVTANNKWLVQFSLIEESLPPDMGFFWVFACYFSEIKHFLLTSKTISASEYASNYSIMSKFIIVYGNYSCYGSCDSNFAFLCPRRIPYMLFYIKYGNFVIIKIRVEFWKYFLIIGTD